MRPGRSLNGAGVPAVARIGCGAGQQHFALEGAEHARDARRGREVLVQPHIELVTREKIRVRACLVGLEARERPAQGFGRARSGHEHCRRCRGSSRDTPGDGAVHRPKIGDAQQTSGARCDHSPGGVVSLRRSSWARSNMSNAPAAAADASHAVFMSAVLIAMLTRRGGANGELQRADEEVVDGLGFHGRPDGLEIPPTIGDARGERQERIRRGTRQLTNLLQTRRRLP